MPEWISSIIPYLEQEFSHLSELDFPTVVKTGTIYAKWYEGIFNFYNYKVLYLKVIKYLINNKICLV